MPVQVPALLVPMVVNAVRPQLLRMTSAYVATQKVNNLSNEGFAQKSQEQWQEEEKNLEDIEIDEGIKEGLKEVESKDSESEPDADIDEEDTEGKKLEDIEIPQDIKEKLSEIESDGQDLDAEDRTFADGVKDKSINEDTGKAKGIEIGDQGKLENADSIIEDRENGTKEDKIQEILKAGNRWGEYNLAETKSENLEMEISNQELDLNPDQEQNFLEVARGTNFDFYNTDSEPSQEIDAPANDNESYFTEEQERHFIELAGEDNYINNYPEPTYELNNLKIDHEPSMEMDANDSDGDGSSGDGGGGDGGGGDGE